ncbi:MAG: chorismate synthase [Actinomycetaceae bacterium]|nr:chorismate synthase [Actinomycetaceae bacterium]MDY6082790.1 chorismate synthase [Actinomycetaceae bacterium]
MPDIFGRNLKVAIFGESHGPAVGAVIDGFPAGIVVDEELLERKLNQRRARGRISTGRHEPDVPKILSGVYRGHTTGTAIGIVFPNSDVRSKDYDVLKAIARPGHADWTNYVKSFGFNDHRGGGHSSGRLTAPLVAAGAFAAMALANRGIKAGTHIAALAGIDDRAFATGTDAIDSDIDTLDQSLFPVLDSQAGERMQQAIISAARDGDSVGGILETVVAHVPAGVGDPFFDSLESQLAHGLFAIPAVKGVAFGSGFGFAGMRGSEANDPFRMEAGRPVTVSNHNGGINGGISNGMPIVFRTVIKPTPSIYHSQSTVNFVEGKDVQVRLKGRHDPAVIHRGRAVQDAVTAIVVLDALMTRDIQRSWAEHPSHPTLR